jgi:tRNA(fMet)-specific endonuclease VapC
MLMTALGKWATSVCHKRLDTNIVSNLVRDPRGRVADRIKAIGEQNICTSIIVAAELRCGTTKKPSPRLSTQVEPVLGAIDTLPFDSPHTIS